MPGVSVVLVHLIFVRISILEVDVVRLAGDLGFLRGPLCRLLLLARQLREVAVGPAEYNARVHQVEEQQRQEHGCGVEHKRVGLVCEDWVVDSRTGAELSQTEDDTNLVRCR